jgi:hypothetical protein
VTVGQVAVHTYHVPIAVTPQSAVVRRAVR